MNSTGAVIGRQEADVRARSWDLEVSPNGGSRSRWFRYQIGSSALEEQACTGSGAPADAILSQVSLRTLPRRQNPGWVVHALGLGGARVDATAGGQEKPSQTAWLN